MLLEPMEEANLLERQEDATHNKVLSPMLATSEKIDNSHSNMKDVSIEEGRCKDVEQSLVLRY